MKIGIFDSGLGGLVITSAIANELPSYDLVYFGDTARVPYGDRSQAAIYQYTKDAVHALYTKHDCALVILACNTASAQALRKLQQQYLPEHFPDRRILGVIIPTVESVTPGARVGLLATRSTVRSGTFQQELELRNPCSAFVAEAGPLLVPLIENNALRFLEPILEEHLTKFREEKIDELILGCTHFGVISTHIQRRLPNVRVLAQENIVPSKLASYLKRHPEIDSRLTRCGRRRFLLTDVLDHYQHTTQSLIGLDLNFEFHDSAQEELVP